MTDAGSWSMPSICKPSANCSNVSLPAPLLSMDLKTWKSSPISFILSSVAMQNIEALRK
eukprot:CAMPEP_0115539318 /NCGR_PEP_ID=MMETSP0271-20121206/89346_1 /TAXON_ID=71861 /ORGANISM="Scrippsiella trochoidea, Strain CCMP3099" /LENGTH=58 /DNA_ID=CAMNT_0002972269 /DNA_START=59 /DNA_END=235 /DNA_ORIENTATION=-